MDTGEPQSLISFYDRQPEDEKRRFTRYCRDRLDESASNGIVSTTAFLDVIHVYCSFREMRGRGCVVSEESTFQTLPKDVQIAFLHSLCADGPREMQLQCIESIGMGSISVSTEWTNDICLSTFPLLVNKNTSVSDTGDYRSYTDVESTHISSHFGKDYDQGAGNVFERPGIQTRGKELNSIDKSKKGKKGKKDSEMLPATAGEKDPMDDPLWVEASEPTNIPLYSKPPSQDVFSTIPPIEATSDGDIVGSGLIQRGPTETEKTSNQSTRFDDKSAVIGLCVGIAMIPVVFFLFVKVYQRQRSPKRMDPGPALLEDISIVSENSIHLAAMGSKFRKSDDCNDLSLASGRNNVMIVVSPNLLAQRIRQAFNSMYQYLEDDSPRRVPSEMVCPVMPQEDHVVDEVPVIARPRNPPRQIAKFRMDSNVSYDETMNNCEVDRGAILLPSDYLYLREFQTVANEFERSGIPVVYQSSQPTLTSVTEHQQSSPDPLFHTDGRTTRPLPPPTPRANNLQLIRNKPLISPAASHVSEASTTVHSDSIRVDVLREEKYLNDLRIVGVANDGSSNDSLHESLVSYPTDEDAVPSTPNHVFESGIVQPQPMLAPALFGRLSNEVDVLVQKGLEVNDKDEKETRPQKEDTVCPSESAEVEVSEDFFPTQPWTVMKRSRKLGRQNPTVFRNSVSFCSDKNASQSTASSVVPNTNMFCHSMECPNQEPPKAFPGERKPRVPRSLSTKFWQDEYRRNSASAGTQSTGTSKGTHLSRQGVEVVLRESGSVDRGANDYSSLEKLPNIV